MDRTNRIGNRNLLTANTNIGGIKVSGRSKGFCFRKGVGSVFSFYDVKRGGERRG